MLFFPCISFTLETFKTFDLKNLQFFLNKKSPKYSLKKRVFLRISRLSYFFRKVRQQDDIFTFFKSFPINIKLLTCKMVFLLKFPQNHILGLFGRLLLGKLSQKRRVQLRLASGNAEQIMLRNKQYVKHYIVCP